MNAGDRSLMWICVVTGGMAVALAAPALADSQWLPWAGLTNAWNSGYPLADVDVTDNGAYVVTYSTDASRCGVKRFSTANADMGFSQVGNFTGDSYPGSAVWGLDGDFVTVLKSAGIQAARFYGAAGAYGSTTQLWTETAASPLSVAAWSNGNYVAYFSGYISASRRTAVTVQDAGNTSIVAPVALSSPPDGRIISGVVVHDAGEVAVTSNDRFVTLAPHSTATTNHALYLAAWHVNGSALESKSYVMASTVETTGTEPSIHQAGLAVNATGLVIVAWYDDNGATNNPCDIKINVYQLGTGISTNLTAVTNFTANSMDGHNYAPDVAIDPDGRFVVVWAHRDGTTAKGVYMRAFKADFTPLTDEVLVAAPPDPDWTGLTMYPRVSLSRQVLRPAGASKGYVGVVLWCSKGSGNNTVSTRRFVFATPVPRGTIVMTY